MVTPTYHRIGSTPVSDGQAEQRHLAFVAQRDAFEVACSSTDGYHTRARSRVLEYLSGPVKK